MFPLHAAIENMDEQDVVDLLSSGADPNQPDPEAGGLRPLQLAVDIEHEACLRRLDLGDDKARPKPVITRILINAGADPDLPDESGQTARSMAEGKGYREALSLFGDNQMKPNELGRSDNRGRYLRAAQFFGIYILSMAACALFLVLVWHYGASTAWRFLSPEQLDKLQLVLFSGTIGGLLTGFWRSMAK